MASRDCVTPKQDNSKDDNMGYDKFMKKGGVDDDDNKVCATAVTLWTGICLQSTSSQQLDKAMVGLQRYWDFYLFREPAHPLLALSPQLCC